LTVGLQLDTNGHAWNSKDSVAELAHDLRQPLATIRALVASLKATEASPDVLRWHVENIEEQLEDLGYFVHALLAMLVGVPGTNTAETGRCVEANSSLAAVVQSFAVTWPGRISTAVGETTVVPVPPDKLRRAVRNVLDNAARAAGENGSILVSVTSSVLGTCIAVEDDGPGFGALPTQHSIGLRIVERTLSEAGGSLEVTTSEVLGGARVSLYFPPER
jgi:signal transduction histidine kinase